MIGIQGAGKSTIGRLLAGRFERGAYIDGDDLWRMVVSGRADMTPEPAAEAVDQLHLRYRHGALLADSFFAAGFVAVQSDNIYGEDLNRHIDLVSARPIYVVVLNPSTAAVAKRERARGYDAYRPWMTPGDDLEAAIDRFQGYLTTTPKVGLWLDTSRQDPGESVEEILSRTTEALVRR